MLKSSGDALKGDGEEFKFNVKTFKDDSEALNRGGVL